MPAHHISTTMEDWINSSSELFESELRGNRRSRKFLPELPEPGVDHMLPNDASPHDDEPEDGTSPTSTVESEKPTPAKVAQKLPEGCYRPTNIRVRHAVSPRRPPRRAPASVQGPADRSPDQASSSERVGERHPISGGDDSLAQRKRPRPLKPPWSSQGL